MIFIDRKAQIEELELSVISIEKIPPGRTILTSPPHILP